MAEQLLDILVVRFDGDLKPYEAALDAVEKSMADTAAKLKDQWSNSWQGMGQDVNVARESTSQFTREYTTAMQAAGASTERIASDISTLNQQMKANHDEVRSGNQTREEYRKTLEQQRGQLQNLINQYNQAAKSSGTYTDSLKDTTDESKELDETIKRLSNEVRTSRSDWASRIISDEQFRESTEALHKEIWELRNTSELTGDQMKKMAGDMAFAQRGLDSVNKVASRGGLAWTAQIGIADAFGNSLRGLGPAGAVAAGGLRGAQMGFAALVTPINLADLNLKKLAVSLGTVTRLLPLLAGAGAIAAVAGLYRMANASAEMATQMEVAAERTGLTVEALQEYQYAAQTAGVSGERFNTVAQRILRRAADARAGNEGLAQAFAQLNVSLEDADGNLRGVDDLLGQLADGLFQVENQGERVALAFKIMDTEGSQMLNFLSAGSEGLAELRREARELGLVISGDTIMSLSEFGNQVAQVQRQFEVARTEIAAAFLPVLQDWLVPLLQNHVVPWIQNAAIAVGDWTDKFVETGDAGDEFRAQIGSWLDPLVRFGRLVGGVAQLVGALGSGVLSTAANLGAGLGTMIAQLEQMRPIVDEFINISTLSPLTPQYWQGMSRLMGGLSAADITIDPAEIVRAAKEAGQVYHDTAQALVTEGVAAIGLALTGDSFTLELADTVRSAVTRGASTGLTDLLTTPELDEFGNAIGDATGKGISAAAQVALAQAAINVTRLRPDEGEGRDWRTLYNEQREQTQARRERELARAERTEQAHLDRLRAAYERHYADQERRATAAAIGVANAVGSVAGSVEGNLLGIEQAEVERAAAYAAQLERVAEAAARIAARGLAYPQPDEGQGGEFGGIYAELEEALALADAQLAAFGDSFDVNAAKASAYQGAVNALLTAGVDPLNQGVLALVASLGEQNAAADEATRIALVQELALQRLAEGAVEAAQTQGAYAALMATINSFGDVPADPLAEFRAQLVELGRTGHLTGAEVADGLRAITAAGERLNAANVAALTDEFETLERRVQELAGIAPSVFDDLRKDIEELIEKYEAAGESVEHLAELLELLKRTEGADAQTEAAQQLADTLSDVESWLRTIGDAAGGAFGQFASGLADAVGIATKFVSGDIPGAVQDLVGTVISGITDIINANNEWSNSLDQLGERYQNLSRTTVEALAVSKQETRWFLFIPYTVRVVDEGATQEAVQTAQQMLGAVENALKSADFGVDFELGLDRVIQQEMINAFLLTPEVQAAIVAFNEAIRNQDWSAAEAAYRQIAGLTEEQNRLLKQQFPELYKINDKAQDYADAIERANNATRSLLVTTAQGTLAREWEQGIIGLEEYGKRLARLNREAVDADFIAQRNALREEWNQARRDGADPAYIQALSDQIDALGDAWREAIKNGTHEAAQAVRQILGTSLDSITGSLASAFDTSTVEEFTRAWEVNLLRTTRNALIQAFLHSEAIRPLLEEISGIMTEAALAGEELTSEQMNYLRALIGQTGTIGEKFWGWLEELGLSMDDLTDEVNAATGAMSNVPNIWKGVMRQFDAVSVNPNSVGTPAWAGQSAGPILSGRPVSEPIIINQNIQGSVLAQREVESLAVNAVDEEQARRGISRSGL